MRDWTGDEASMEDRIKAAEQISCRLVNSREFEKCIAFVQSSIKDSVDSFTIRMNEVACYINRQNWLDAVRTLDDAHEKYNSHGLTESQQHLSIMYYSLVEQEIGDVDKAEKALRELALLKKEDEIVQFNYSLSLIKKKKYREAIDRLLEIVIKRPEWGAAYFSVANCYQNLGLDGEAIFWYKQALKKNDAHNVRLNLSLSLLRSGRFEEGWREFENRPRTWNLDWLRCNWHPGDEIRGKSVAIITDEGIGDAIMFMPLLAKVVKDSLRHVVYADKRLASVFKRCIPGLIIETRVNDNRYKEYDVFMRLASLAGVYYTTKEDIAQRSSYLTCDEVEKKKWARKLANSKCLRVGIGWRGGVGRDAIEKRSVPLIEWKILGKGLNVEWISLQHRPDRDQINAANSCYNVDIKVFEKLGEDIEELTALIENLDLIITCEQTVAHIAGALGKECLVLAASPPGWRYIEDLDIATHRRMLWYKSVTLIRQNDWAICEKKIKALQ
ncbi:tetratricopeptide repeat-containing glycosyltransferase family protein [Synechococcus sp. LTW-R]|uniref:tetratricopeptide repeat-containing glycosyltransferase family protein n=1 Tax=Synechococcus sp. LTW-R TaxID=2751170 RepID=UPI001628E1CD|nr:tetratricopeptide repeat-containing glycosyltransferase family protein [Synechococcus sp. LTW-R]QNG29589.1 glycosyltransferase family protein [Synechococcus sp. LTW-R]